MKLLVITGDQGTGKSRLADFIKKVAPQVAVFDPLDDDNLPHFKHVRSMGVPCVVVEQRLAGHARAIYEMAGALLVELGMTKV